MVADCSQRRQRLRRATQKAHASLDARIGEHGMLSSRESYQAYLQAVWIARRPLELALEHSTAAEVYPPWRERDVSAALSQDITDLSGRRPLDPPCGNRASTPLTAAQALGVFYVLEGSALGARVLEMRALAIGMTPTFGARHLARQTAQPKAWSVFVDILDRAPLSAPDDLACVAAARAAFEAFELAFLSGANDR